MTRSPVYVAGAGIVSPLGRGLDATEAALRADRSALGPPSALALGPGAAVLPVGGIADPGSAPLLPRTHCLAREAALMAMAGSAAPPDAVCIGCTTGGILTTEQLLREGTTDPTRYRGHGLFSVAEAVADCIGCHGPALALSTACSSGAVALALALGLLRSGRMRSVLAGGVDSLCRLTYFGFHSLQLVDRDHCRPLDEARRGLNVAEGAGLLLLTTERPQHPLALLLGAGLSCDAHHPTAPHPEGKGALAAMRAALADADLAPEAVDYINLHGTGTPDNDLAEARAITALFPAPPPLSSIKGATGHSLAAAGGIEAVVACLALARGLVPGTVGCTRVDPALGLSPQLRCSGRPLRTVLSNSFGFGGNNGCLVLARPDFPLPFARPRDAGDFLAVHGSACLTGAGRKEATLARLWADGSAAGQLDPEELAGLLPGRLIRRIKRFGRLALLLALDACADGRGRTGPTAVFLGTGWGALSETWDFLHRLEQSAEQFPSPTDFVGSVHNSAAGQVALALQAQGANVTASGGDFSFEQALLAALSQLDPTGQSALLMGVDQGHAGFSPLLDPSVAAGPLADGGGALMVNRNPDAARCLVRLPFYGRGEAADDPDRLIAALGGAESIRRTYAAVLAGVPAGRRDRANRQAAAFTARVGPGLPVWPYRSATGEFASASAVAAVLAVDCLAQGRIPGALTGGHELPLAPGQRLLVLGCGDCCTAMEFCPPCTSC